jgi:hypothetical protein
MAAAVALIDAILELDRKAPRKQRHTSRRIFDRIRAEVPSCTPAERTVRQYVERRKRELGLAMHETFVPQSYDWSVEAQINWFEAYADIDGERVKVYVFSMRSMASGAAFHRAYLGRQLVTLVMRNASAHAAEHHYMFSFNQAGNMISLASLAWVGKTLPMSAFWLHWGNRPNDRERRIEPAWQ